MRLTREVNRKTIIIIIIIITTTTTTTTKRYYYITAAAPAAAPYDRNKFTVLISDAATAMTIAAMKKNRV